MRFEKFVIGVDYGTDSVRSIIVKTDTGQEVASAVFNYPRWGDGLYCNAALQQFRQHPADYTEGLISTVRQCLKEAGPAVRNNIAALSIDTTGSTPVAVDEQGISLALHDTFANDPDAMFVLWKDHSAAAEAAAINEHARKQDVNYLRYVGGIYSSEWFWAKLLHVLKTNSKISKACYSWVEHCDWMPFLLTGKQHINEMKRSVCTAGHKALWSEEWGGLPPDSFFMALDPVLAGFADRLYKKVYTADQPAGKLCAEWAEKLGLSTDVVIGIGAMDAHMAAVGGQIEPYYLSKVMGTSTCDMLVAPSGEMKGKFVEGICGQVNGSVIPGMVGMEAGQSAFGDVYAWFKQVLSWPLKHLPGVTGENAINEIIPELSRMAAQIPVHRQLELSTDWFNGRRTPDANALLKAAITGLHLGTDAPAIFRSLVESTCFGAKAITERFQEQSIAIKGLIGIGGIARKSPFIMQMLADIMNMPIKINKSDQTAALGAAMFAATIAGEYGKVEEAMAGMGQGFDSWYYPDPAKSVIYSDRYQQYKELGRFAEDHICQVSTGPNNREELN